MCFSLTLSHRFVCSSGSAHARPCAFPDKDGRQINAFVRVQKLGEEGEGMLEKVKLERNPRSADEKRVNQVESLISYLKEFKI